MKMKHSLGIAVLLLLLPMQAFAQRTTTQQSAPATFTLTVAVSPSNATARIFVDNVEIKGNSVSVQRGDRVIRVTAPGFIDFTTTVNVTANITVPVTLQPQTANLTINVNPGTANARIFVDNIEIKGNVVSVPLGSRSLRVAAEGFIDFNTTVNVTANVSVPVSLQPRMANLTVNVSPANIGARIFIDNVEIKGNVATVALGNRLVRVSAPNFVDFQSTIAINGDVTVPVALQPATASVNVQISPAYQNKELGNRFFAQLSFFVDGQRVNLPANSTSFSIPAGQRTLRIVSGGMQTELSFNFIAGKAYTIEPVFSVLIKE